MTHAEAVRAWERFPVRTQIDAQPLGIAPDVRERLLRTPAALREHATAAPDVTFVVDVDALSHCGPDASVPSADLARELGRALDAARRLGPVGRQRLASSSVTARTHLDVFCTMANNTWTVGYGLDGADLHLVEELEDVQRRAQTRRCAAAVVLVGADHAYAEPVSRLRAAGVPTWLIAPDRRSLSFALRRAATAVTFLTDGDGG